MLQYIVCLSFAMHSQYIFFFFRNEDDGFSSYVFRLELKPHEIDIVDLIFIRLCPHLNGFLTESSGTKQKIEISFYAILILT